ncbi:hypothetical protein CJ030_MR5G025041 [Morella rubra]|uniref:Uncharacterized protein n=1 Tax=Morella rubra TaxID=262757 RepID=A0A6A1VHX5_9ROSI|nr:hypothetical protein CJ030_MR5G025041 [Morella rubra]
MKDDPPWCTFTDAVIEKSAPLFISSAAGATEDFKHKGKLLASAMPRTPSHLAPPVAVGHSSVTRTTVLSPFRGTLAMAIREIDEASAPPLIIPTTSFFKEAAVHDGFGYYPEA